MQKVYIFDLDGTLIDSMPTGVGIVLGFLDEKGISYPRIESKPKKVDEDEFIHPKKSMIICLMA